MSYATFAPIAPRLETEQVALVGGGPLAHTTARILAGSGSRVRMVPRRGQAIEAIEGVSPTDDLGEAVRGASVLFLAVAAADLDELSCELGPHVVPDQVAIVASRGITRGFRLPHEHLRAHTCLRKIGVLGGPVHVRELAAGRRINVVVASRFSEVFDATARIVRGAAISLHPSRDVVGVEIAGAIANVASVAAGMAQTLALGETARGVLLARGVVEARVLAVAHGAVADTFAGLAGLGELIPREVRSMERHLELGRRLGEGRPLADALTGMDGHVEGIETSRETALRARVLELDLPLVEAVAAVIDGRAPARDRLEAVLARPLPLDRA